MMDPALKIPLPVVIQTSNLTAALGYLLAGIPSTTFYFCNSTRCFSLTPGTCLPGVSPESLASLCTQYIEAGNTARKLEEFCAEEIFLGNIFEGFKNGVRSFLRVYTNAVVTLSIKFGSNLGELEQVLRPLLRQVSFLGGVCNLKAVVPCDSPTLPTGVSLL